MIYNHTVWQLMRRYTKRQIQEDAVRELTNYININIENFIKNVITESENLLQYNGIDKNRISKDVIQGVIKRYKYLPLPVSTGGIGDIKRKAKNNSNLQNEVRYHE